MDTTLAKRLHDYIGQMAPHHRDRDGGKLLIEAAAEIRKLETVLRNLMPFVLEDYYPEFAAPEFKAAVQAAFDATPPP